MYSKSRLLEGLKIDQEKLNSLFSSTKSSQMVYEKIPERKIIKIYSLDEHQLVNGVFEFNINHTNKLSKQISQKGLQFIPVEDYFG